MSVLKIAGSPCRLCFCRYMRQDIQQVFPEFFYGRNMHSFVGRVHSCECRPEGYHVECGIFVEEQAAFQSGMNCFYFGVYTEQAFIGFGGYCEDNRMRVGLPSRIAVAECDIGARQPEDGPDRICHIVTCGQDGAALAGLDADDIAGFHFDGSEVRGCFH